MCSLENYWNGFWKNSILWFLRNSILWFLRNHKIFLVLSWFWCNLSHINLYRPWTIHRRKRPHTLISDSVVIVFQLLSHVWLFATPWTAVCQATLSLTISGSLLKFMSIESVMPSNHLILCCPLFSSCLRSFVTSRSFPVSWLFSSGGQSIGASASASVIPRNIQD